MARLPLFLLVSILLSTCIPHGGAAPPTFACSGGPEKALPFCNVTLPISARVTDLIGRLTLDEKIGMLVDNATGIPRLGIKGYQWWSEALHGISSTGHGVLFGGDYPAATSFPQVIATASSFNTTLWELIGKAVSDEGRAMYNGGRAGLTFWSPNVNVFRDPRWGRGQETPGEDPVVVARFGVSYVRGLQQPYGDPHGPSSRLKVAACCKHYTAYDLDNWQRFDRYHFDAKVSKQDLEDTYNVPFKACVLEGKVASVMCSFNKVNGVPTCADPHLLHDTIRGQWALDGYIVADCDSVSVLYYRQNYTSNPEDAAAVAIRAGLDLDCGRFLAQHTGSAVKQGKVSEAQINAALHNTISVQMRLGMYDGEPSKQAFGNLGPKDVCSQAHQTLALEAARQAVVLLENKGSALPLSPSRLRSVAVVGPNSNATVTMRGNYAGVPCGYTSPLQGIEKHVKASHQMGCTNVTCVGNQPIDAAVEAARQSDATILVVGLDQSVETEGRDRDGLLLPGRQQELVSKVANASKGPAILVVMSGGPVDVDFAKNDPKIFAILWVGYPGQAGGAAIADVIFGAFNPGGRLPMTWYPQGYVEKVPMTDMAMRADPARGYPGRSYRFYKGPVVYPYGHGLSYTRFAHSLASAPAHISVPLAAGNSTGAGKAVHVSDVSCGNLSIAIHVDVKNVGDRDGSHTVLVYSTDTQRVPQKQLVAFEKVHVAAGGQARAELGVHVCRDLSFADENGIRMIPIGERTLQIGDVIHSVSFKAEAHRP